MKIKKDVSEEIRSVLGEGVELVGEVVFNHGLRVDGSMKGKLQSEASLVIGPKGKVEAEAYVRLVSINGELRGAIHASDRVEIHKEGRVYGDIYTPCLLIEAGAVFEGKCHMSDLQTEAGKRGESDRISPAAPSTGLPPTKKDK